MEFGNEPNKKKDSTMVHTSNFSVQYPHYSNQARMIERLNVMLCISFTKYIYSMLIAYISCCQDYGCRIKSHNYG